MKDHKKMHGVYFRVGLFLSLVIFAMLFAVVPYHAPEPYELDEDIVRIGDTVFTYLDPIQEPPEDDARPKVALDADPDYADSAALTIEPSDFIENPITDRPKGPDIEIVPYYRLEIKPQLVKSTKPVYPDLARRAGIEGATVVKMLVDIDGRVIEVLIIKSSGNTLLDQAAVTAARQHQFTVARQRDRPVRVWISRQFAFRLTG